MSPDRTGGPVDLIHVATISRGQNRVPCRFIMNKNPAAYALIYQTKAKKDLAYTRLQDLEGFTERICGETHDFPDTSFIDTELYEAAWDIRTEMRSEGCMSYCTEIEDYGETKPKDWDWDRFDLGPFSTIRSLRFTIRRDKERPMSLTILLPPIPGAVIHLSTLRTREKMKRCGKPKTRTATLCLVMATYI